MIPAKLRSTAFAFGEPPAWLVRAAAAGCRSLADLAARSSLEQHDGPIDALSQEPALLAEFNRWLGQAAHVEQTTLFGESYVYDCIRNGEQNGFGT